MKKILMPICMGFLLFASVSFTQAQTLKFGHINSAELMQAMPETDSAQATLQKYAKELENNITLMQTELQNKYTDYQNSQGQWSELIKQTKQKEIQDMQTRTQDFMQQADEDYKTKSQSLLTPIMNKAKKAIEEVAKEGKYSYIFDSSAGAVLYGVDSDDVMLIVKKKLGLTK
ncbi:MAG: OmpH family outer membrane protein [Bacteroidales bacterium]